MKNDFEVNAAQKKEGFLSFFFLSRRQAQRGGQWGA